MRAAVRYLCKHGIEALRPHLKNEKWRKPMISRRVAADLKKAAIRTGTYGKFDSETGVGWDPLWDTPQPNRNRFKYNNANLLASANTEDDMASAIDEILMGSNKGGIHNIRPPKGHKRERTRENRAQKIEKLLEQADQKIEDYRLERVGRKPGTGIEEEYKAIAKSASW